MSKLFNRASVALLTNLLNLVLFSLVFSAGLLNIVRGYKSLTDIATNVYLCSLALFLFVTELVCFNVVIQQCPFLYTHRGRGFVYLYLGCFVYLQNSIYHQLSGIYCIVMACLLLILSFFKQFPGRCELKVSIVWLRKGLEPELRKTIIRDCEVKSEKIIENSSQQHPLPVITSPPIICSPAYPNYVYHPIYRAPPGFTSNPNLNRITARSPRNEGMPPQALRYSESTLPHNSANGGLVTNIPQWNTIHSSRHFHPSPNPWRYNPLMNAYTHLDGSHPEFLSRGSPIRLQSQSMIV